MVTEVEYKKFRAEIKEMAQPYGVIWGINNPKFSVIGFSKSVEEALEKMRGEVDKYYVGNKGSYYEN